MIFRLVILFMFCSAAWSQLLPIPLHIRTTGALVPQTNTVLFAWDMSNPDPGWYQYVLVYGTNTFTTTNNVGHTNFGVLNLRVNWRWSIGVQARDTNQIGTNQLSDMSNIITWPLTNFYFRNTVQTSSVVTGPWTMDARWPIVNITNPPQLFERLLVEKVYY